MSLWGIGTGSELAAATAPAMGEALGFGVGAAVGVGRLSGSRNGITFQKEGASKNNPGRQNAKKDLLQVISLFISRAFSSHIRA